MRKGEGTASKVANCSNMSSQEEEEAEEIEADEEDEEESTEAAGEVVVARSKKMTGNKRLAVR